MKKLFLYFFCIVFLMSFAACNTNTADKNDKITSDVNQIKEFTQTDVKQVVKDMKLGWNLGNTLDATGSGNSLNSETSWQQPKTTKQMIDGLVSSGIKTIRIPVSWAHHMDVNTYKIDEAWMNRVQEIVDWAIDDGMYVILNTHHDNVLTAGKIGKCTGYYPTTDNYEESERFLVQVWTQISDTFNNKYDEHLIFETMNEPRPAGTADEWWYDSTHTICRDAADCINKLNQKCLDTIRASGGNNKKRFVMVPAMCASPDAAFISMKMPKDDEKGKIILSVHMYTPYEFAMQSPGDVKYTDAHKGTLDYYFGKLNSAFIKNGYPVVIGEYGATNKNNLQDRVKWFTDFLTGAKKYGITCCLWDNGSWQVTGNDYNEHYGFYNRKDQTWYFPEILNAMVESTK